MSNPQATLFKLEVLLNTEGEIVLESSKPPDSKLVEKAFNDWNCSFEETKKIVSLVEYLRDYQNNFIKNVEKFI
tara:strand:- start:1087 stop:1308 length:222 start_codon:yes stop_codon:yes gene_type:complete